MNATSFLFSIFALSSLLVYYFSLFSFIYLIFSLNFSYSVFFFFHLFSLLFSFYFFCFLLYFPVHNIILPLLYSFLPLFFILFSFFHICPFIFLFLSPFSLYFSFFLLFLFSFLFLNSLFTCGCFCCSCRYLLYFMLFLILFCCVLFCPVSTKQQLEWHGYGRATQSANLRQDPTIMGQQHSRLDYNRRAQITHMRNKLRISKRLQYIKHLLNMTNPQRLGDI